MIEEINQELYTNFLSRLKSFKTTDDYVDGPIIKTNNWDSYLYSMCFPYWQTYTYQRDPDRNGYMIKNFPSTYYKTFLTPKLLIKSKLKAQ